MAQITHVMMCMHDADTQQKHKFWTDLQNNEDKKASTGESDIFARLLQDATIRQRKHDVVDDLLN